MVQLGLSRVCSGFFGFRCPVECVRAVPPRGSCLFWGDWALGPFSLSLLGGLWVLGSPLVFWLCYWGACRGAWTGACAAGLRLLWPFLNLLLGGFGKIQVTQVIRFAIYVHKVGNADAKYHGIQFSNKCCCFFVSF